jgi:5-carboxymethyl-2-hydroxymuconate isomerase
MAKPVLLDEGLLTRYGSTAASIAAKSQWVNAAAQGPKRMPHFIVDYSANLEGDIDLDALVECLRAAAVATGIFPLGGIRVRAHKAEASTIADGRPDYAFLDLTLRLATGRPLEVRKAAGEAIFEALSRHLDPAFTKRKIALSFEIKEIDPDLSWRRNTIHDFLKGGG